MSIATTTPKIKRHFFFTEKTRTISKTYGGSTYTLAVYEIVKKGVVKYIGEVKACTRAHKGELHEAWTAVVNKVLTKKEKEVLKDINGDLEYFPHRAAENYGLTMLKY